ncbi:hypothetical protein F5148DRAFT_275263 [Russula earlei]|uniref:Uncharacterized protein n=1 Tax=Russula earlei TaxID=71964 RepID=A0ACC0U3I4_9AGAM|nr:hypothetical protein F5148DRAFT_275263 [Russula earlei]
MMSSASNVASPSNFESLFQAALAKYAKKTGQGLVNHPLAVMIDRCDSPVALLAIYEKQALAFDEFRNGDPKLIKWLAPVVNGLHALTTSAGISAGASLAFPPAKAIFAGIGVLLSTAKRLMIYTEIPPTPAMTEIVLKIMVELLNVLALATKQINQGRLKKYASKLLRGGDVEAVLQRLDRLTLEESRTTVAQTLEVIYGLVNNMEVVMEDGKSSTDDIRQALVLMQDIRNQSKQDGTSVFSHVGPSGQVG